MSTIDFRAIARKRIPVWSLVSWQRLGAGDEEILANFPALRPVDLLNAWNYAARHADEIEGEIRDNEMAE